MTFADTSVLMHAVGRPHALRANAQELFVEADRGGGPLCTSAQVLRKVALVYLPIGRLQAFDAALGLMASAGVQVWPLKEADVALARQLHDLHPALKARDLCHSASCRRRRVREIKTFYRTFAAASASPTAESS